MNCPHCDHPQSKVNSTRRDTIESVIRQRNCCLCGKGWHTLEVELPRGSVAHTRSTGELERRVGFKRVQFS